MTTFTATRTVSLALAAVLTLALFAGTNALAGHQIHVAAAQQQQQQAVQVLAAVTPAHRIAHA